MLVLVLVLEVVVVEELCWPVLDVCEVCEVVDEPVTLDEVVVLDVLVAWAGCA